MSESPQTKEKSALAEPAVSQNQKKSTQETPSHKSKDVVIEFDHVTKRYPGQITAADDVSFKICLGEFISVVGPSGAGKSTLIRLLTCEERPTGGHIYVAGRDVTKLKPKELPFYRRKVGVIFQDFKLLPRKTVYENIAFALEVADAPNWEIKESVPKIIEIVGLSTRSNAMTEELSGGEKQRVSIARALVHKPKLLIADEPTGNLDPVTTWEIIELLFKINQQGTIVILATHDREVVDSLERRVMSMKNGAIVSDQEKGKYIL
ncbi:MAG: cell division ATP-binding protein FtsE [Patescibacteria group bacterium]|jgi:cell division transport system ATP-binding protein